MSNSCIEDKNVERGQKFWFRLIVGCYILHIFQSRKLFLRALWKRSTDITSLHVHTQHIYNCEKDEKRGGYVRVENGFFFEQKFWFFFSYFPPWFRGMYRRRRDNIRELRRLGPHATPWGNGTTQCNTEKKKKNPNGRNNKRSKNVAPDWKYYTTGWCGDYIGNFIESPRPQIDVYFFQSNIILTKEYTKRVREVFFSFFLSRTKLEMVAIGYTEKYLGGNI